MKNRPSVIKGIVCAGLILIIWSVFFICNFFIRRRVTVVPDNYSYVYQIDSAVQEGKKLTVTGWAFEVNRNSEAEMFEVILFDQKNGKYYFPKMTYSDRKDIDEYFKCTYDYSHCGFKAELALNKLNLNENEYTVLLRYDVANTKDAVNTGILIGKDGISYSKENTALKQEFAGTELEKVLTEGQFCAAQKDFGVSVYRYGNEMYWIVAKEYPFWKENDFTVQFHLYTTQIEKLPSHRFEQGLVFDNLAFKFSANEIQTLETANYRVAKREIPDYPIYKMLTGHYETVTDWLWKEEYRISAKH